MGEQTLEFELLTCINMLNKKKKKINLCLSLSPETVDQAQAEGEWTAVQLPHLPDGVLHRLRHQPRYVFVLFRVVKTTLSSSYNIS